MNIEVKKMDGGAAESVRTQKDSGFCCPLPTPINAFANRPAAVLIHRFAQNNE